MKKEYIVSIDMGGTKILASLINSNEGVISRLKKPTAIGKRRIRFAEKIYGIVEELIFNSNIKPTAIKAIALGVPGSVDPFSGIIGMAPNLGIKNYNIKADLQRFTKIPVIIENDVNLAALGVSNYGVAKDLKNVLVVFIGTGIGGGIVLDGKLYRGSSFVAGEIGHLLVKENGPLCGCGKYGCFETLASRSAMVNSIVSEINNGKKSILAKHVKRNLPIKSKALSTAVAANDKLTITIVGEASRLIGSTLANINNLLNFEMIVLGGGAVHAMSRFMIPEIKRSFKETSLIDAGRKVKIVASKLGDYAALYGGIALAKEFLGVEV